MKCAATVSAFIRVSNYCFSILKYENTVWAKFNTAWFPALAQPSHLSEKITGNQGPSKLSNNVHLSILGTFLSNAATVRFED